MARTRSAYPAEFRLQMVALVQAGRSPEQVAILSLAAGRWASPALRAPQRLDDVTKNLRPGLGRRE